MRRDDYFDNDTFGLEDDELNIDLSALDSALDFDELDEDPDEGQDEDTQYENNIDIIDSDEAEDLSFDDLDIEYEDSDTEGTEGLSFDDLDIEYGDSDSDSLAIEDGVSEDFDEGLDEGLDEDSEEDYGEDFDEDSDELTIEETSKKPSIKKETVVSEQPKEVELEKTFIDKNGAIVVADAKDDGDKFTLNYIDIKAITIPKRRIRRFTNPEALITSIQKTGLLKPLEVIQDKEGKYILIDGCRRLVACAKCGIRRVPVIINTKININDADILGALYNHYTTYTNKEIIDYIDYLEKEKSIYDGNLIEFLLQLNSGDYSKLKDLLSDNDSDIMEKLLDDKLTIGAAFKKLESRRKKESRELKESKQAEKAYNEPEAASGLDAAGIMGDSENSLTDEELKEMSFTPQDIAEAGNDDASLDDIVSESNKMDGFEPHKQDYKHREILSPELRKAVLARDENTCQICKSISGQEYTEVLDVHHIIEVYLGGADDIDNLITACTVCHKLIHLYARGDLHIRPESELSEDDKAKFKRIVKLGNVIRQGMAKKGMKRNELKKVDKAETIGRTKPGTERQVAG